MSLCLPISVFFHCSAVFSFVPYLLCILFQLFSLFTHIIVWRGLVEKPWSVVRVVKLAKNLRKLTQQGDKKLHKHIKYHCRIHILRRWVDNPMHKSEAISKILKKETHSYCLYLLRVAYLQKLPLILSLWDPCLTKPAGDVTAQYYFIPIVLVTISISIVQISSFYKR